MSFISLWPLLLAQVTVMSLTVIFLAADRRFFSWDCFVVCTLSMMMAEGIVIMKYELWHILLPCWVWQECCHGCCYSIQDIFQAYQKVSISVCGLLLPQCFLVQE